METTKTVELKNAVLLAMKKIQSSVNPVCKKHTLSLQNDVQTNYSSVIKCFLKPLEKHLDNF